MITAHIERQSDSSFAGPLNHTFTDRDIEENGLYLTVPDDGRPGAGRKIYLSRHAMHHLHIAYGPGKSKIASIQSTVTLFGVMTACDDTATPVLQAERTESRNWVYEYETWDDLENRLAGGDFIKYASEEARQETRQRYDVLARKAESYCRKFDSSYFVEYHTYGTEYRHRKRVIIKTKMSGASLI